MSKDTPTPAAEALAAIEKAEAEVDRLNKEFWGSGKVSWRVSIPVERARDSDFLLSDALCKAKAALRAGDPLAQGLGEAAPPEERHPTSQEIGTMRYLANAFLIWDTEEHIAPGSRRAVSAYQHLRDVWAALSPSPAPASPAYILSASDGCEMWEILGVIVGKEAAEKEVARLMAMPREDERYTVSMREVSLGQVNTPNGYGEYTYCPGCSEAAEHEVTHIPPLCSTESPQGSPERSEGVPTTQPTPAAPEGQEEARP